MLSLIGELAHTCRVVLPNRTFLRCMIDLNCSLSPALAPLDLHKQRLPIGSSVVALFTGRLEQCNPPIDPLLNTSQYQSVLRCLRQLGLRRPLGLKLDPGTLVCRLVTCSHPNKGASPSSPGIWGPLWSNKHVLVRSNNMVVVEIIRARISRDSLNMHLLRCLHFLCALHSIHVRASHIPGVENTPADIIT